MPPPNREPLIPKHGGYRKLKSFQIAQLVFDVTVRFCNRYLDRRTRTCDQMVQAARSGVQNIAEGSQAAGTSRKTELKLTNVARASLEELRLDYEDFLRQRNLPLWERDDFRRADLIARRCQSADCVAKWVKEQRGPSGQTGQNGETAVSGLTGPRQNQKPRLTKAIQPILSTKSTLSTYPELSANAALVLIAVACSLLDRQIAAQAAKFEQEGGFTERLYRIRRAARENGK